MNKVRTSSLWADAVLGWVPEAAAMRNLFAIAHLLTLIGVSWASVAFGHGEDAETRKKLDRFRKLYAAERDASMTPCLLDGVGRVHFSSSSRSPLAQTYIAQGV